MIVSSMFDSDESYNAKKQAPAEKHLQSPITSSLLDRLISLYNAILLESVNSRFSQGKIPVIPSYVTPLIDTVVRKNVKFQYSNLEAIATPWLEVLGGTTTAPKILTPDLYPEYLHRTLASQSSLNNSLSEAYDLYRSEITAFRHWAKTPELQKIADIELERSVDLSRGTYVQYESYRYWDFIVEKYRSRKSREDYGRSPLIIFGSSFYFFDGFVMEQIGDITVIKDDTGKTIKRIAPIRRLITYEQLQMLQDATLARFNAFLAIDADMHNGTASLKRFLCELLKWQEDVLSAYGNKGYELVKGPESIAKSYLTTLSDGEVMPISSFVRTIGKLKQKEIKLSGNNKTLLVDRLVTLIEQSKNYNDTAELFGCTKLSGHPFVYAEISAESVKEEGCSTGHIDLLAVRDSHAHFKRIVLTRYLEKHKTWPPFLKGHEPRKHTKVHEYWTSQIYSFSSTSYPISDLYDLEFDKFMEFDYSPDYLDMIDDKAISPGAQHSSSFWFPKASTASRRLLENLIVKPDIDTHAIVERMRRGKFHTDERIIELTQKEREFKTSARCFCKLTFEVRLFFVLTEANLKRFAGGDSGDNGYLPQQTMTMSNAKVRKRLYDMTSTKTRKNSCVVEIDFSRWNLRWRASTVNPIARSLENIFGLRGVFSQAHNFFSSSTIVLTDKHSLPTGVKSGLHARFWPESDLVWRNHIGGFEGIQQTLWTICTIAMMYFALRDENCSFKIAGQGDNQVFHLTFNKTDRTLSSLLLDLLKSIERECERLNQEIKPEECIDSMTVLTYGKEIYISGVHVLYSLKFSSRAFARADYTTPSLTKEIASIVSNSIAVSSTLTKSIRAIWWKFIQVLLLLRRRLNSPIHSSEHAGIKRLLKSKNSRNLLLIPGSVGGLPMMPWTRYFSKGETDDLSFDCAATYYLSQDVNIVKNYMSLLVAGEFTSHEIDTTNLVNDPHSIPIDRPNDASHLISAAVSERLPGLVKNKDLKQLVQPSLRNNGEKYKELLTLMRPLHPDIVADLFDLTPAGLYNKTVKRFSMTRTIESLVPGLDLSGQISEASAKILSVLLDRMVISARHHGRQHKRPFETASMLRDLWNCEVKNTSVGIYTPFDFEIGSFTTRTPTLSASIPPDCKLLTTCGQSPPNFGTTTRQKLSSHGYKIANSNSTMRDIKSAVVIYSELMGDSSIDGIINSIITARSPWTLDPLLRILSTQYGGTAVHRHAASKHHFAMLGSCSVPTHVTFSSDRAGVLSGGELDYPVVFQTLYLTLSNLFQNLASFEIQLPTTLAYYIPAALEPIDTSPSKLPRSVPNIAWPDLSNNKLAYVSTMFASEVPIVPDPLLIPHLTRNPPDFDLIYSYLESVVSPTLDNMRVWDTVVSPRDIFDLKEIARVDPWVVEYSLAWALLTDVFSDSLGSDTSDWTSVLSKLLKKKSLLYAGCYVRIRLHPMYLGTQYNKSRRITMTPGNNGYKRPVDYLGSILRRTVKHILETRGASSFPKLILFNDWKNYAARLAKRRLTVTHVLATYPDIDQNHLIRAIKAATPPRELLDRDPSTALHAATRAMSRKIAGRDYELPEAPCRYINKSPEESLRELRSKDKADLYDKPNISYPHVHDHGILRYTISHDEGTLHPPETSSTISNENRLRVLRRRVMGSYSPLYSDWISVIIHMKNIFRSDTIVHLYGVGNGATARTFCDLGIDCIGYDLQSSFPILAHRSASYIPPEAAMSSNSSLFSWSDHTYTTSGDVMVGDLDTWNENDVGVVDLDMDLNSLLMFLERLTLGSTLFVRYRGSEDAVRYLISILRPTRTYVLVSINNMPRDIVCYIEKSSPIGHGNYDAVHITSCREIRYNFQANELIPQFCMFERAVAKSEGIEYDDDPALVAQFLRLLARNRSDRLQKHLTNLRLLLNPNVDISILSRSQLRTHAIVQNILDSYPEHSTS
nr:RNA-dependent RNA polymerase [Diaporthe negative-stranded RNA virus 1]